MCAKRGRPPALNRDEIARAVLEIGFTEITFASVSTHLKVGQTTLFRYVKDRDELVRLGLDRLLTQVNWPGLEGDWRQVLNDYALTAWHAWAKYPGSATEVGRGIVPPRMMQLFDELVAMLIRVGFSPDGAVLAVDVVFDLVSDNRRGVEHLDDFSLNGRESLHRLWSNSSEDSAEQARIHQAIRDAITMDALTWFTGKLRIVLDGIQASSRLYVGASERSLRDQ